MHFSWVIWRWHHNVYLTLVYKEHMCSSNTTLHSHADSCWTFFAGLESNSSTVPSGEVHKCTLYLQALDRVFSLCVKWHWFAQAAAAGTTSKEAAMFGSHWGLISYVVNTGICCCLFQLGLRTDQLLGRPAAAVHVWASWIVASVSQWLRWHARTKPRMRSRQPRSRIPRNPEHTLTFQRHSRRCSIGILRWWAFPVESGWTKSSTASLPWWNIFQIWSDCSRSVILWPFAWLERLVTTWIFQSSNLACWPHCDPCFQPPGIPTMSWLGIGRLAETESSWKSLQNDTHIWRVWKQLQLLKSVYIYMFRLCSHVVSVHSVELGAVLSKLTPCNYLFWHLHPLVDASICVPRVEELRCCAVHFLNRSKLKVNRSESSVLCWAFDACLSRDQWPSFWLLVVLVAMHLWSKSDSASRDVCSGLKNPSGRWFVRLWDNIETLLKKTMGKPLLWEQSLSRMLSSLEDEQMFNYRVGLYDRFFAAVPAGPAEQEDLGKVGIWKGAPDKWW